MRLLPALVLLLLAPFIGEFLLGNLPPDPLSWAFGVLPLILLYGGGALLIREITRRLGRGYPTMVLLAVSYGLIEEGIVLGTLFNRDYLGMGLLESGYLPALGTSLVWSTYVVGIHSVWSILVPIVLTEHLFPRFGDRPWLRLPGTIVVAVIYVLGAALVAFGNFLTYRFVPGAGQLIAVGVLVVVGIVLALTVPRLAKRAGAVPPPIVIAGVAAIGGSIFLAVMIVEPLAGMLGPVAVLGLLIASAAAVAAVLALAARRAGWTHRHTLAAATGAVAAYGWVGFVIQISTYGPTPLGGGAQAAWVALATLLTALAWRRVSVESIAGSPHQR